MSGIYDITPFSALDYPNNLSAIVWFSGCNLRCRYCHNLDVVDGSANLDEEDVLSFLDRRSGLLDGVVLSGGEATLYANLKNFSEAIKLRGFKVKLDTNGTRPDVLEELILEGLIDCVAIDFKANRSNYSHISQSKNYYQKNIESIKIAIRSNIEHYIRTTYSDDFSPSDIDEMRSTLYKLGASQDRVTFQKASNQLSSL